MFWSGDRNEPPHVHAVHIHFKNRGKQEAKLWLAPIDVAKVVDIPDHELKSPSSDCFLRKVQEKQTEFLKAWHEHFGRH
ncbi:MAG: DUF4160 domain-containing protein [Gammaproteobacteria bacterium]